MKSLKLFNVFVNIMLALVLTLAIAVPTQMSSLSAFALFGALNVLPFVLPSFLPSGALNMGLLVEVWTSDIKEVLYDNAKFVLQATNHDEFADKKTVHIPQSGSGPGISKNRASVPATPGQRTDTVLDYSMDEYTTDPVLLKNIEELQVSYDKRMSVMRQHINALSERIGLETAYSWAPSTGRNIATTGADGNDALAPSATGTRKAITVADVAKLANAMDQDLISEEGRILLLPSSMFWQLFAISDVVRSSYNGFQNQPSALQSGIVAELLGFKIMRKKTVNIFATGGAVKAVGTAGATTDKLGALAFHPTSVSKALGSIDIMSDFGDNGKGKPEYFGGILSALVMHGASKMRTDENGLYNLVQGA